MLLLASAGSGKSTALQIKFIDAVNQWKTGQPLPIYFNLANGIEIEKVLQSIDIELKTNI